MFSLTRLTIRRAREERLAQVAGSLTFTTMLSIVPFLAASFALFTRFSLQAIREGDRRVPVEEPASGGHLADGPEVSESVRREREQPDRAGLLFVLATAMAILLTVENALNQIWEVKRGRPFLKRVGLYLLMLAIGPPVLGASLWATSHVLSASMGLIGTVPPSVKFELTLAPVLSAVGLAAMFYFVPNTRVRRRDAIAGGLLASIAFELGKRGFAAYMIKVPTYKVVYGAFAAFPVFLLWVYFSWLVTLTGALITANLARAKPRLLRITKWTTVSTLRSP
jgi:membrane protein